MTPTLTLEELLAWVDSQLNDEETRAEDPRAPLREWADLEEAA